MNMQPYRRIIAANNPKDIRLVDEVACTATYLRGAISEQRHRLKWAQDYRREFKYQDIAGRTNSVNFIDHGLHILRKLEKSPSEIDESFVADLVERLQEIHGMRKTLCDPTSFAIDYGTPFWGMVDMLTDALVRLGYKVL